MVWLDLAVAWLRIGLLGFGGGPAMIPLMKAECVDGFAWMTDEEFLEALAAGTVLPGPLSAKMSVYVGMKAGGPVGALVALLAVGAPAAGLMVVLGVALHRWRTVPAVMGATAAAKPVVIALLLWTVLDLAPGAVRDLPSGVLALIALAALALRVHPAIVIAGALAVGALFWR